MKKIILTAGFLLALPVASFAMGENLEELVPGYGVETGSMKAVTPSRVQSGNTFNESNDLNPDWQGPN